MLRLSGLRWDQTFAGRAGQNGRAMPRLQGRRDPRAAQPARQDFLRMRSLSKVQIRVLGSADRASVSKLRLTLPGREDDQAARHAMALPEERRMRLCNARPGTSGRAAI